MKYADQIKHPKWQRLRLEVFEINNFVCQECKSDNNELHAHHPYYRDGAMIWDYPAGELMCLCASCHSSFHKIDSMVKTSLSILTYQQKKIILSHIKSFNNPLELKKLRAKLKLLDGEL